MIRHMYATGRGRVVIRGQVAFEEDARGRISVVITELPYQVNKTTLIEKMAELVSGKRITDVSDIRDESDRTGMRIVVEIKRDGSPHTVHAAALQAHRAPDQLQREHAGARRRAAADARPEADARALHRVSARDHPAADRVRPRPRPRARAHPRGPEDRARQPRRGDQDDPRARPTPTRRARRWSSASSSARRRPTRSWRCSSAGWPRSSARRSRTSTRASFASSPSSRTCSPTRARSSPPSATSSRS